MGLSTKKIAEIRITTSPRNKILEEIRKYLEKAESGKRKAERNNQKPFVIFTPNPEIIVYAQKDKNFIQIVNSAQINLPDGGGVVWALRKLNGISVERISGVNFMLDLCNLANSQSLTVGLIGGKVGVALKTKECLLEVFPKLKIEVLEAPEIIVSRIKYHVLSIKNKNIRNTHYVILNTNGEKDRETDTYFKLLTEEIGKKRIDILFVGLGFPKQEYFIDSVKRQASSVKLNKPLVLMAVGGSFDYISGRVPRAPKFMREAGFEWLYRLIREPWRLPRQAKGAEFFWRVFVAKPR